MFSSEREKIEIFNEAFRKYYNNVIYYALHYVDTYEEARDVAQEVFEALWAKMDLYDCGNLLPCLLTMAKNNCLNVLRKERNRRIHSQYIYRSRKQDINISSLTNSSIESLFEKETRKAMMQSLEKVPSKTREAFILNRFKNKTYEEIAEIQHVSEKNIEYRISHALRILKHAMGMLFCIFLNFM